MPRSRPHPSHPFLFSLTGIPVWIVFALSIATAIERNRPSRHVHYVPADGETLTVSRKASTKAGNSNKPLAPLSRLTSVEDAIAAALPASKAATVVIRAVHSREFSEAVGTGVIISADGLVLTAGHVVDRPGQRVTVTLADGEERFGTSLGISLWSDAGMVRIDGAENLPFAPIAEENQFPDLNEWTFALGHPGGLDEQRGVVLRVGRILELDPFTIRSSCKLLGGDSGGPLFDLQGRVIGINSRISQDVDDNYHVSLAAFQRRWTALKEGRTLGEKEGFVGVVTEDESEHLVIRQVLEHSAAHEILEVGDFCTHVNGVRVASGDLFRALVKEHSPGEIVTLDILREGETRQVELQLGEAPKR